MLPRRPPVSYTHLSFSTNNAIQCGLGQYWRSQDKNFYIFQDLYSLIVRQIVFKITVICAINHNKAFLNFVQLV